MPASDNVAIIRRYFEGINRGNDAVFDELVSPDCVPHILWYQPMSSAPATASAPEHLKRNFAAMRQDFSDVTIILDEVIEAGDRVIVCTTMRSTHRSGTPVTSQGITIFRLAEGKIVEIWTCRDRLGEFQQLGVLPATQELLAKAGLRQHVQMHSMPSAAR